MPPAPPANPERGPEQPFQLVYDELHALASAWFRSRRGGDTLQPTALVHEAYLKLAQGKTARWSDEEHFRATAAKAMRHALISHARGKGRDKRGGGWDRVTLSGIGSEPGLAEVDLLALEEALATLESLHSRHARVIELRFFAGLTEQQIARILDVSERTVSADWRAARAWLLNRLAHAP